MKSPEDSTAPHAGRESHGGWRSRARRAAPWAAIVVLALALRLAYLVQIQAIPLTHILVGDAAAYDAWARRILGGDWMGHETFYQAPAYPYFVAVVYRLLGADANVLRVVQAVLGAGACLFLGLAARSFFDRRTGLVAAALLAAYPPAIFFCGLVQKTALTVFLLTALLWTVAAHRSTPRTSRSLLAGLLLALLALTRENALVLALAIVPWLAAKPGTLSRRRRIGAAATFVVGLAAPLLLVAWRNHHVGGAWAVTTTQAGPNFWIGNNPNATGMYVALVPGHESVEYERTDARRLAEEGAGRPLTDGEVSRYWLGKSLGFIRDEPLAWLRLMGRKTLLALNSFEVPDTEGYGVYRGFAWMLEVLASVLHFGVLVPLAAAGVVLTWPLRRKLALLYAMLAVLFVSIVSFYIFGRYRFPLVPFAVMFAAAGIVEATRRTRKRRLRSLGPAGLAAGVAAIAANLPLVDAAGMDALMFENVALVLAENEQLEAAGAVLDIAIEKRGDLARLHLNRARVYRLSGEPEQALAELQKAHQLDPGLPGIALQVALCHELRGDRAEALAWFEQALRENPDDPAAQAGRQRLAP